MTTERKVSELSDTEVLEEVDRLLDEAGPFELRYLLTQLRRNVELGQRMYGEANPHEDKRKWLLEMLEEQQDGTFYLWSHLMREGDL